MTKMRTGDSNCPECDFPLDDNGDCTNAECETNLINEHEYRDPLDEKDNIPNDEEDYYDMLDGIEEDEGDNEEQEPKVD